MMFVAKAVSMSLTRSWHLYNWPDKTISGKTSESFKVGFKTGLHLCIVIWTKKNVFDLLWHVNSVHWSMSSLLFHVSPSDVWSDQVRKFNLFVQRLWQTNTGSTNVSRWPSCASACGAGVETFRSHRRRFRPWNLWGESEGVGQLGNDAPIPAFNHDPFKLLLRKKNMRLK